MLAFRAGKKCDRKRLQRYEHMQRASRMHAGMNEVTVQACMLLPQAASRSTCVLQPSRLVLDSVLVAPVSAPAGSAVRR